MLCRDDDSAPEHHVFGAEDPFARPRSEQLREIDRAPIGTDDSGRGRGAHVESAVGEGVEEVEGEDALQAVVGEALPQFCEGHAPDARGSRHSERSGPSLSLRALERLTPSPLRVWIVTTYCPNFSPMLTEFLSGRGTLTARSVEFNGEK